MATAEAPASRSAERKLASSVHEEYHDPFDDWSSRDIFLSLAPFVVSYAFKLVSLRAALAWGIAWSGFLLLMRTSAYDSRRKEIWPIVDITTLISFAVLRGLMRRFDYWILKWWTIILPLTFAFVGILTLLWRRPFTAHYARFPKFDRGGHGLWHSDASFRRTADLSTLGWISAWSAMLLLSLIPVLTGNWGTYNVLEIIFDLVIPFLLLAMALVLQQVLGAWYRSTSARTATVSESGYERGAGQPAGPAAATGQGVPATYSSAA